MVTPSVVFGDFGARWRVVEELEPTVLTSTTSTAEGHLCKAYLVLDNNVALLLGWFAPETALDILPCSAVYVSVGPVSRQL